MATYQTPGVYIEEIRKLPASVAAVETAIPVFVGYTESNTGGASDPVLVTSLLDYQAKFGTTTAHPFSIEYNDDTSGATLVRTVTVTQGTQSDFMMYYSIQAFYANGGGDCYVLSVGPESGGITHGDITTALAKIEKVDRPTLIVVPDAGTVANYAGVYAKALEICHDMQDRFTIIDLKTPADATNIGTILTEFRGSIGSSYLNYGAAYYPYLASTFPLVYDETAQMVTPKTDGVAGADVTLESLSTSNPSIYREIVAKLRSFSATIPPSGAVAGVYAKTDRDRGVWKAPANVSINAVSGPVANLRQSDNDKMNVDADTGKSVNAIRKFTGKGTKVWGARTLAGNDNEWRYVPVRRLFIFVEESIKKATEFVVFEPNDANTWLRTKAMIESFLTTLWRQGAFQGATTAEAFYVSVGLGTTMSQDDILNGIMNIEIGLAAVRPAEFIVLKFSHFIQQS